MSTERESLRIDADLRRNLEPEAKLEDRFPSCPAAGMIETMLYDGIRKWAAIHMAVAASDEGVFLSQAATEAGIASWDTDPEFPPLGPATTDAAGPIAGASMTAAVDALFFTLPHRPCRIPL